MKGPWILTLLVTFAALATSGCSDLTTDYGQSRGISGRKSLNGFGALRTAYQRAGFRTRDISRLTNRVRRTDVIVWTPMMPGSIDNRVTGWFDRWLRQGNRTLVYVLPDSGSEADYWLDACRFAPPEQRLEYRKRAGQSINQRIQWRLNREPIESNGWFQVKPTEDHRIVRQWNGPWQEDLRRSPSATGASGASESGASESGGGGGFDGETSLQPLASLEFLLAPYDDQSPSPGATGSNKPIGPITGPTGPGSPLWTVPVQTQRTSTPLEFTPLLLADSDRAVIGEVRSTQWPNSRILVVAGGSLLTNYAFSREPNRRLADKIIAESASSPEEIERTAGFLTSQFGMVPVSEREANAPRASGMEFLTEWPISAVTMHGVVLGLIVCLMLFPIFGRPKKVRRTEANEFGHHLDAVAALMKRVGGEAYARGRISDYMKRMHGETSGPWVIPDRDTTASKSASLPRSDPKRLTSKDASSISAPLETGHSNPPGQDQMVGDPYANQASDPRANQASGDSSPPMTTENQFRDEADR